MKLMNTARAVPGTTTRLLGTRSPPARRLGTSHYLVNLGNTASPQLWRACDRCVGQSAFTLAHCGGRVTGVEGRVRLP